ncbi:histidine phosphatase family protein [Paenibacillus sp. Z6-24]
MKMQIVLLRHGTTQWNREKKYLGHTDLPLIAEAQQELEPVRRALEEWQWDGMYCSDLLRCRETLERIMPRSLHSESMPAVIHDARLRELDFGRWEGLTYNDLCEQPAYRRWIDDPSSICPPDGESWQHFSQRVEQFARMILPDSGTVDHFSDRSPFQDQPAAAKNVTDMPLFLDRSDSVRRIMVMTHGGVIRQFITWCCPGIHFWELTILPGRGYLLNWDTADCEVVAFPL